MKKHRLRSTRRLPGGLAASFAGLALVFSQSAQAATESWIGATTGLWGTNTNWSDSVTPDSTYDLTIAGPGGTAGSALTINVAAAASANSINFTNTAATTLSNTTSGANQTLTLGSGGLTTGTGAVTIGSSTANQNINIALGASQTWNVGSGGLTAANVISGSGFGLTKSGAGILQLNGANTYSGGTTVSGGTFRFGANSAGSAGAPTSGPAGTGSITLNGGILDNAAVGNINVYNNIVIGTGTNEIRNGSVNDINILGGLSGSGNLILGNNNITATFVLQPASNTMTSGTITFAAGGNNVVRIRSVNAGNANVAYVFNNTIAGKTSLEMSGTNTISFGSMTGNGNVRQNSAGTLTISAGALGLNDTFSGTLTQGSGSNIIALTKVGTVTMTLSGTNTYTGVTTLTGGTLSVATIGNGGVAGNLGQASNAAANLVFDGGTLQYTGATASTNRNFTINGGKTATFDVTTNNLTVSGASTATTGALTKTGAGTLTLTGTNLYTGATSVNGGTLVLSGTGAINSSSGITVNGSGAKLLQTSSVAGTPAITLTQGTVDGTGTLGAVTVANLAGNVVQNGNGGTSTLTLGGLAFNGAATLNIADSGVAATPGISVTGALSTTPASGQVTINVTGSSWSPTSYNLLGYGSFSGALSDFTQGTVSGLTSRQSALLGLDTTNKFITLTISGDNPRWSGLDNGNWVVGSTGASSNWKLITSGAPTDYIQGDAVYFNDSAEGTTAVNISAANVSPTAVTFDNSSLSYTLGSTGGFGIAGTAALTKTGTGTVTISNANTYSGGTNINNGTLALSGSGTLGSGTVTLGGGTLDLSGGSSTVPAVAITAAATSGNVIQNGTLTPSSLTATNSTGNAIVAANIAGSTAVTMSGTGTLTLSGANTYTGGTTVGNGTLVLANGGSLSTSNTLTLGSASGDTSGIFQLGDSNGTANTTVTSIATAGAGTANAVVGGNSSVSTLTVNNSSAVSYSGKLGGAGTNQNNLALVKSGAGTLTLSGASTYSGGTTLNAGTLAFQSDTAFGTGTITSNGGTISNTATGADLTTTNNMVMNSGTTTLDTTTKNWTINGNISGSGAISRGTSGTVTVYLGGDNSGYTGTFTSPNNGNAVVRFNSVNAGSASASWVFNNSTNDRTSLNFGTGTISFGSMTGGGNIRSNGGGGTTGTISAGALNLDDTFSGTIVNGTGTTALTKVGTGTMTLSGANTYTGATTINGGTLRVNGSLSTSSAVGFSGTGSTLAGAGNGTTTGKVGAITLTTGNFIAPGDGVTAIGTLTATSLDLSGGHFTFDLSAIGNTSDMIALSGALTDSGTSYTFDFSGGLVSQTYTLITFTSTTFVDASKFASTGVSGTFSLLGTSLTFTAIPEPHEYAMAIVGLLGMLVFIRRRKQQV